MDSETAQAVLKLEERQKRLDAFWVAVHRSYDIEPREFFEREAPASGNWSPEEMCLHHIWKREPRVADLLETLDRLKAAQVAALSEAAAAKANVRRRGASEVELEIGECECGYHFGVDATYLDQVGDFVFDCPSCKAKIDTAQAFPE